jgi:hypothetical protein
MYSNLPIKATSNQNVICAWHEGIGQAQPDVHHVNQFIRRQGDLLPRFAEHYERLKKLPRPVRRGLQRYWKKTLPAIALLLALNASPALAATINVGANCTLGRAITSANNNTSVGGCTRGVGADRIVLPRNSTQTLSTVNNTVYGPTGLPVIRSTITIDGNGSIIRRASTAPNFRIFAVSPLSAFRLQEATVSRGIAANRSGGALYNGDGTVTISESIISANRAGFGGGIASNGALAYGGDGITLTNSTVTGNMAVTGGGVGNGGDGGGGYTGLVVVNNSTISGNTATTGRGGGLANTYAGFLNVNNSTVSGNTATGQGGGVCDQELLFLTNTTLSHNTAGTRGGSVLTDGNRGDTTFVRSLVSGNSAADGREISNIYGDITAGNFNVLGHSGETNAQAFVGFTAGATDITATSNGNDPTALNAILNTTLANNGGPTRTHALVAGSPAVDSVNNGTCPPPARDQRGVTRPRDGNGDGGPAAIPDRLNGEAVMVLLTGCTRTPRRCAV